MRKTIQNLFLTTAVAIIFLGCNTNKKEESTNNEMKQKVENYTEVTLTTDLEWLSDDERQIISKLIDVAQIMDEIFWMQAYGNKDSLFAKIEDEHAAQYAQIHYGPWDRLKNNEPFIEGVDKKPEGANFYPA